MPKLCQFENCKKRANYGTNEKKNIFCKEHKTSEMSNMCALRCQNDECNKIATFNYDGEKAKYCSEHKLDDMVDIRTKRCEFNGCKIFPSFNFEGEKKSRFCFEHKLDNMIDVKSKKCSFENCKLAPSFNFEGNAAKYCLTHKLEGMTNVSHKKCSHFNCKLSPSFNFEGEKTPLFCSTHKLNNMIDVKNFKCSCGNSCSFNLIGLKPKYCSTCKTDDMINVKHDSCKNNGCPASANKKYKNYCSYCFQHLFPLDPLTFQIRCKTKELAVRDFINANYEGFNHDKILEYGGCDCLTRRRIDHRKLIGNTLLCIETDENQHKSYSKEDEEARYNDLLVNFTCKYIIIRFNPDSYVNKKGVKTNPYISARLEELKKEMDKQIKRIENNENAELLEVVHLYYDGYK